MRPQHFSDFSDGVLESIAPTAFTERHASVLRGFVFDTEQTVRSQWPVQRIGGLDNIRAIHAAGGDGHDYLIALRNDGTLWWCVGPDRLASDATTAAFSSWTQLIRAKDAVTDVMTPVVPDADRRFLCEVPVSISAARQQTGVLINSLDGAGHPLLVYRDGTGMAALIYTQRYPSTYMGNADGTANAAGTVELVRDTTMPRANIGAMWGDVLCLADAEWFANPVAQSKNALVPLGGLMADGSRNAKRFAAGFWSSYVDNSFAADPTAFHPSNSFNSGFISPEATILGMQQVQSGMLVFTAPAHSSDGVVLLRGKPYNYTVEPIRAGVGLSAAAAKPGAGAHPTVGWWPETASVAFVENTGSVWNTDGQRAWVLNRSGYATNTKAGEYDHAQALRGYLFVFAEGKCRLLSLLSVDDTDGFGCWTELVLPSASDVTSSAAVEDSMYFVQDGTLYRFQMSSTRARGTIDGAPITVVAASAPVASGGPSDRGRWARVGVRAHTRTTGRLVSLASVAGSPLASPAPPALVSELDLPLEGQGQAVIARGHGVSTVAAVRAVFTGDVTLESLSVYEHGAAESRSGSVGGRAGGE